MYFLGIDWAAEKHDLCLLDETGAIVQQMKIEQSNSRFRRLEDLVNHYGVANILCNIERSDGLLVDWMVAQGWALHVTPSFTRRSGKALHAVFRRACSHPIRKAFNDFARQSVRYSSWARAIWIPKWGMVIVSDCRALANRWARIIWTLWQRREAYDEAKPLAN